MPGKPRRGRGKHPARSKKRQGTVARVAQQQATGEADRSAVLPKTPTPAPAARTTTMRYPYVTRELRTIGILTGIMLAILVILSIVLR